MTDRELLEMALDVIETYGLDYMHGLPKKYYVITLHARLEQPEREWVGLTDDDIEGITARVLTTLTQDVWPIALSRAIETKLKEKNHCSTNNHKENSNEETK